MAEHLITHIEIPAIDQAASAAFYSELFGWNANYVAEMNYTMVDAGGEPTVGLPGVDGQGTKVGDVRVHVNTSDILASLAKAESLGGKTVFPKTEIPGMGWFALFSDPAGNVIGLFEGLPS